jgi:phage tail-like protein
MSQLIEHLPAIYREGTSEDDERRADKFLRPYLQAFEQVLLDTEKDFPSLQQEVEDIPRLFDAEDTPERFLSWLAGWIALTLHPELIVSRRRRLIGEMAKLYRIRGTREYLQIILKLQLDAEPAVSDMDLPGLQIADHSTVGVDTYLGGGPPFLFHVNLALPRRDEGFAERQARLARDLLDMEKPAHTWYKLTWTYPRL